MPFYFFFGLLGLVIGGLLTWFFLADHPFESLETPGSDRKPQTPWWEPRRPADVFSNSEPANGL